MASITHLLFADPNLNHYFFFHILGAFSGLGPLLRKTCMKTVRPNTFTKGFVVIQAEIRCEGQEFERVA